MKSKWRASALLEALVDALLIVAGYAMALWMLFGTYVLALWGLATLVYAGQLVRQVILPPAHCRGRHDEA